jgi:hypothetical protein
MENIVEYAILTIVILGVIGFVLVFLSIGFAFGDKTDLYEDNEGNIHLDCPGNLWNGRSQSKYPSKIDWDDLQ